MATHKPGIQIMRINKIRSISLPDLIIYKYNGKYKIVNNKRHYYVLNWLLRQYICDIKKYRFLTRKEYS